MSVKVIIHEQGIFEQVAFRLQTWHLDYKSGIWRTKLAFRLQKCSFQFTNKHLVLQNGISDYNSARDLTGSFYVEEKAVLWYNKLSVL